MLVVLRVNKAKNVRMRYAHHAHVGSPSNAALLYDLGDLVDDVHERDWTGSRAVAKANACALRSEKFVGHSGSAACLMYESGKFRMVHDSGEGIRNGENKTSSELSSIASSIHEARRVGNEFAF